MEKSWTEKDADIDANSWHPIQELISSEQSPRNEAVVVPPGSAHTNQHSRVGATQQQEEQDRTIARRLQAIEEEHRASWKRNQSKQEASHRDASFRLHRTRQDEEQNRIFAKALQGEWQNDDRDRVARRIQEEEDRQIVILIQQQQDRERKDLVVAELFQREETAKIQQHGRREEQDMVVARQLQEEDDLEVARRLGREELLRHKRSQHHPSKEQVLASLMTCQRQAVEYVEAKAKTMHDQCMQKVKARISRLGPMAEMDMLQCLEYIRDDAPIVIHLTAKTLSLLLKDTHYRNLFETSTSGGSANKSDRKIWESRMFGRAYDGCKAVERPKYGALNVSGDIAGVKSARFYGKFFLILHQHCRHRCTFFNDDTGNFVDTETLATNEYYAHVLNEYNDADLSAVLNTCKWARLGGARSQCSTYKEVQIHGPVCLATDILALSIPGCERTASKRLISDVTKFQKMSSCNLLWQQDLLHPYEDHSLD